MNTSNNLTDKLVKLKDNIQTQLIANLELSNYLNASPKEINNLKKTILNE